MNTFAHKNHDRHNHSSHNGSHTVEPKNPLHKSIIQDSSKSNYPSTNIREASQIRLEDNLAHRKNATLPKASPSQEQDFEDGELVGSEPLPSQQVRDFLLPLVLKNAAHREKEGEDELTRLTAQSVLSDEVCSSFMHQMREVRSEMHAHKNRSSNPPEMQHMEKTNSLGAANAHISPSSKIGQAPPSGPRAMTRPITTGKDMLPDGGTATTSNRSKDKPISALSNHSHDPISSPNFERREPGFRHNPSPERKGFHDQGRGRRFSQHREKFGDHRSRSHSPSRYSPGQPYHRPSDSSRHMARSPPPLIPSPGRRRSPPVPSQTTYFRDRAPRESPEAISGGQSASPSGTSNHNRRRRSLSRDFKRIERPKNISPHWDTSDSPRSPASRRHFDRRRADKVVSPRQPSFTHERGRESSRRRKESIPRSGSFARRSVSPPRRKQYKRLSAERLLRRTPPPYSQRSTTPNPYSELERRRTPPPHLQRSVTPNPYSELERRRTPPPHLQRSATPNPYYEPERRSAPRSLTTFELERRRDLGADYMESVIPGAGSMSTHMTSRATGSHHPSPKPMVIDKKDMHERLNNGVRTPETSDDMQKSRRGVLPCHNVPGVWFAKVALGDIGTLECSFEVDDVTALKWNLRRTK